ncbi:hypothetical protein CEUSTIGMA_g3241.t1 [Chlamydomonas eustigma]|uniref:Uncharacterized protein n=1 Tax=Chlamydomonas eustigma TaxID=1157962 RepID=A0A250WY74_9CHLO|nr:hypothetical protein CEUSTIGMA_g3241.t1 [Chlamydomonas eustigma]|eukprot:GAX75798.1 hypothetical protein CEUSTIGMA_g3241.t1 [Chlamydomonas eustigma]
MTMPCWGTISCCFRGQNRKQQATAGHNSYMLPSLDSGPPAACSVSSVQELQNQTSAVATVASSYSEEALITVGHHEAQSECKPPIDGQHTEPRCTVSLTGQHTEPRPTVLLTTIVASDSAERAGIASCDSMEVVTPSSLPLPLASNGLSMEAVVTPSSLPLPLASNGLSMEVVVTPSPLPLPLASNGLSMEAVVTPSPLPLPLASNGLSMEVVVTPSPLPLPLASNGLSKEAVVTPSPLPLPLASNGLSMEAVVTPSPLPLPLASNGLSMVAAQSPPLITPSPARIALVLTPLGDQNPPAPALMEGGPSCTSCSTFWPASSPATVGVDVLELDTHNLQSSSSILEQQQHLMPQLHHGNNDHLLSYRGVASSRAPPRQGGLVVSAPLKPTDRLLRGQGAEVMAGLYQPSQGRGWIASVSHQTLLPSHLLMPAVLDESAGGTRFSAPSPVRTLSQPLHDEEGRSPALCFTTTGTAAVPAVNTSALMNPNSDPSGSSLWCIRQDSLTCSHLPAGANSSSTSSYLQAGAWPAPKASALPSGLHFPYTFAASEAPQQLPSALILKSANSYSSFKGKRHPEVSDQTAPNSLNNILMQGIDLASSGITLQQTQQEVASTFNVIVSSHDGQSISKDSGQGTSSVG